MRIANEFSLKKKTGMTVSDEQNSIHTENGNMNGSNCELHDDMLQKVVGGTEINESELNGILMKEKTYYKNILCYEYLIGSGDTLYKLAKTFHLSSYAIIAELNDIEDPKKIYYGYSLYIPVV